MQWRHVNNAAAAAAADDDDDDAKISSYIPQ